jgi:phage gpG-like protein
MPSDEAERTTHLETAQAELKRAGEYRERAEHAAKQGDHLKAEMLREAARSLHDAASAEFHLEGLAQWRQLETDTRV